MIKYIFSINTGRSGSHYLSKVLQEVSSVSAFHEPKPNMSGRPMINFLEGKPDVLKEMMDEKMEAIHTSEQKNKCYIETNHTFIKGFGWLIPSYLAEEKIGVIVLKREKEQIIQSMLRIDCTPLTYHGLNWIMNPLMKNPINPIPGIDRIKYKVLFFIARLARSQKNPLRFNIQRFKFIRNFEIKYLDWYVKETFDQAEKFKKEFPKIKVYETSIDKLNNVEEFKRMFEFFGIDFIPTKLFTEKINKRTNLKLITK